MLGLIFVEFSEFVAEGYGEDVLDLLLEAPLPSGGAYTRVGYYPFTEMVTLLERLCGEVDAEPGPLLSRFGQHLFSVLAHRYPEFVGAYRTPVELLAHLEEHVHVEVKKLYPEAELPRFETSTGSDGEIWLDYSSPRRLEDLCEGLIRGCFEHYGHGLTLVREPISPDEAATRFRIRDGGSA